MQFLYISYASTEMENILYAKIMKLEQVVNVLTHKVEANRKRSSKTSTYCSLLPDEICGSCLCIDDYELQQKYYCDCQGLTPKRDCLEFYQSGVRINGLYIVTMNNIKIMQVYCDQTTDGGGWTTFQRRADGTINFFRNWQEYKQGFGKYEHEFYLGNEHLYLNPTSHVSKRKHASY